MSDLAAPTPQDEGQPHEHGRKVYDTTAGASITLNYMLGVGVLGLPYAVHKVGLIPAIFILMVVGFVAYLTSTWILQTMYRANVSCGHVDDGHIYRFHNRAYELRGRAAGTLSLLKYFGIVDEEGHCQAAILPSASQYASKARTTESTPLLDQQQERGPGSSLSIAGGNYGAIPEGPREGHESKLSAAVAAEAYICFGDNPREAARAWYVAVQRSLAAAAAARTRTTSAATTPRQSSEGFGHPSPQQMQQPGTPHFQAFPQTPSLRAPPIEAASALAAGNISLAEATWRTLGGEAATLPLPPPPTATTPPLSSRVGALPPEAALLSPVTPISTTAQAAIEQEEQGLGGYLVPSTPAWAMTPLLGAVVIPKRTARSAKVGPSEISTVAAEATHDMVGTTAVASVSDANSEATSEARLSDITSEFPNLDLDEVDESSEKAPNLVHSQARSLNGIRLGPEPAAAIPINSYQRSAASSLFTSQEPASIENKEDMADLAVDETLAALQCKQGLGDPEVVVDTIEPANGTTVVIPPLPTKSVTFSGESGTITSADLASTASESDESSEPESPIAGRPVNHPYRHRLRSPLPLWAPFSMIRKMLFPVSSSDSKRSMLPALTPVSQPLAASFGAHDDAFIVGLPVQFEIVHLVRLFLGPKFVIVYQISLACLMLSSLWAYATVFASSVLALLDQHYPMKSMTFDEWFPSDLPGYLNARWVLAVILFGCMVVPLALRETSEQVFVQKMLSLFRFVSVGLMIIACIWACHADFAESGLRETIDNRLALMYGLPTHPRHSLLVQAAGTSFGGHAPQPQPTAQFVLTDADPLGVRGSRSNPPLTRSVPDGNATLVSPDNGYSDNSPDVGSPDAASPASERVGKLPTIAMPTPEQLARAFDTIPQVSQVVPIMPPQEFVSRSRTFLTSLFPYASKLPSDISYAPLFLSTAIFSVMYQHSVPVIVHPLRTKRRAPRMFAGVMMTAVGLYITLGVAAAAYFGPKVMSAVNLNFDWQRFQFITSTPEDVYGLAGSSNSLSGPAANESGTFQSLLQGIGTSLLYLCSLIMLLFPAVDVISVYPLASITLGNSLKATAPDFLRKRFSPQSLTKLFRVLVAIPPLLLAIMLRNLTMIYAVCGLLGLLVTIITPALLQRQSFLWHVMHRQRLKSKALAAIANNTNNNAGHDGASPTIEKPVAAASGPSTPVGATWSKVMQSMHDENPAMHVRPDESSHHSASGRRSSQRSAGLARRKHFTPLVRVSPNVDTPFGNRCSSEPFVFAVLVFGFLVVFCGLATLT